MLDAIGFYTLSEARVLQASASSPLWRGELILTGRCNFRCPYCRRVGGPDLATEDAKRIVRLWANHGLKNIRFSGGEPTLHRDLPMLVILSATLGIERIAVSTNGSAPLSLYKKLLRFGVNDFSISLDACCASDGATMGGYKRGAFLHTVEAIRELSIRTYTTVGVVLTPDNKNRVEDIIDFADTLGVHDIRVIPAAQHGERLPEIRVGKSLLQKYPILRYRIDNLACGRPVRGLSESDASKCGLVLDDMAAMAGEHYPCIIYLREGGRPIGAVGAAMREDRRQWYRQHDCLKDPICAANCLDVCRDYNHAHRFYHG